MSRLFGLLLVGLVLAGCEAYVALEAVNLAAHAISSQGKSNSSSKANKTQKSEKDLSWADNETVCEYAVATSPWYIVEAKRRNLDCEKYVKKETDEKTIDELASMRDSFVCNFAVYNGRWENRKRYEPHVAEAKRRGLSCGVVEKSTTQITSSTKTKTPVKSTPVSPAAKSLLDSALCVYATRFNTSTNRMEWEQGKNQQHVQEAKRRGLRCAVSEASTAQTASKAGQRLYSIRSISDSSLCIYASASTRNAEYVQEAERRGLTCGVTEASTNQIAGTTNAQSNTPKSAELTAAQKEAERLRQELAALKAQQEQQQQTISNDTQIPLLTIASADTEGKQGVIRGRASDNVGVAEVTIDGKAVAVQSNGSFEYSTFVPATGLTVTVQVTDMAGLSSKQTVSLQRNVELASASISFDRLNPIGKRTMQNSNALALIIGVSDYENTPAKAVFADADAMMFRDYASEKLGIPDSRIKTMVNDNAGIRELLLSVKNWLSRSVKQNQSDVYIFFAGHGLASDDGSKMYLLPYDGAPELLDDTAILRDRLFSDVAAANPRSVTVFLDTCYSGTTRGTDMLIASRPIAIRALEQSIPDNFTVMTAAAGDQTAKPLEEAEQGMFSYFLMKGMEGEADADKNNEITAGELHDYVEQNVWQQSSNTQLPQIQGNKDRVLVRFQ